MKKKNYDYTSATVIWLGIQSICRGFGKRKFGKPVSSKFMIPFTESGKL